MTPERRRGLLIFTTVLMALLLVLFLTDRELIEAPQRPATLEALGPWIAKHPADWLAAAAISDQALDSNLPRRTELWRTAYGHANTLAPQRPNATAAFVRSGLFHWEELRPEERKSVLDAAATLLRDPTVFTSLYTSLWQLTKDLGYLRRVAPPGTGTAQLRDLAATHGEFEHYRQLRQEMRAWRLRGLQERRASVWTPEELLRLLPSHIDTADEPLVRSLLEHLDRSAFDPRQLGGEAAEKLTRYALDHDVQPLSALATLCETPGVITDPTRARLALALGRHDAALRIEMSSSGTPREWLPYYRDRAAHESRSGNEAVAALYRSRAAAVPDTGWSGTCADHELCRTAVREANGPVALRLSPIQSDEIPPYVEIYVDDALVAEGEIGDERTFNVGGPGQHKIELRLVNRFTRNGVQRLVRLS